MQPISPPSLNSSIQGDPAARRFGLYLMVTLAIITVGVIIGIAAGNIAHYNYDGPHANINISYDFLYNKTIFQGNLIPQGSRLWLSSVERVKRSNSSRKIRRKTLKQSSLMMTNC